jgi:hypothetical protein
VAAEPGVPLGPEASVGVGPPGGDDGNEVGVGAGGGVVRGVGEGLGVGGAAMTSARAQWYWIRPSRPPESRQVRVDWSFTTPTVVSAATVPTNVPAFTGSQAALRKSSMNACAPLSIGAPGPATERASILVTGPDRGSNITIQRLSLVLHRQDGVVNEQPMP